MNRINVWLLLFGLVTLSAITAVGIEVAIDSKIVGQWVFMYHGQKRAYEFKNDKTFAGSYPVSGKHFFGAWKVENSTVILIRGGETTNFGIVTLKSDNEAEYLAEGYPMTGQKVEPTSAPAPASLASPPTEEGEPTGGDVNRTAPGDPDDEHMDNSMPQEVNVKDVYPKLDLLTDDQGHPIPQTIRLNEKVIEKDGERYSGFWFVVDRSETARKQGVNGWKGKMALYLYFLPPRGLKTWVLDQVKGEMIGGWSFCPLKLWRFKNIRDRPPHDKDRVVLQQMAGHRLKEGREYYMEFGFPLDYTELNEMTVCLGYRETIWNYKKWAGINKAIGFLGLEHKGKVDQADMIPQRK